LSSPKCLLFWKARLWWFREWASVCCCCCFIGMSPTWIHHIWHIQVVPHEYECSGVSEQLWQKKKKGKSSMLVSYLALSRWHACYFFLDLLRIARVWILYCCIYCVQKAQKRFPKFLTCNLDTVGSIEIRMCLRTWYSQTWHGVWAVYICNWVLK
jgi:hypothetical protein